MVRVVASGLVVRSKPHQGYGRAARGLRFAAPVFVHTPLWQVVQVWRSANPTNEPAQRYLFGR